MRRNTILPLIFFIIAMPVYAVTKSDATASAIASPSATMKITAIDDLKERLATKVAELRQSQKKALFGAVKSITISTLTIETTTSDVKIELEDSLKVFQSLKGKRTELTTDDLEKGDMVVVFGDYDTSLDLMKAKVVVIQNTQPEHIHGTITAIDKTDFTITVQSAEKQLYVVDIEKSTAVQTYSPKDGILKGGFSKIEIGSAVHIAGNKNANIDHRMSAVRILDLGNISGNAQTPTPTVESTESASPSATSNVGPTKKQTPTPKP